MFKVTKAYDKIFIIYLLIYSVVLISILEMPSIMSDEGTHMILSLFYRDLIKTIIQKRDFSFTKAYDFSVSYLVHYPKLQVFYPPLFHFFTGLIMYSIFGINSFAARFSNLLFGVFTIVTLYVFSGKLIDKKSALIGVLIFSLNSTTLSMLRLSMKDFMAILFSLLTVLFFFIAVKKGRFRYFFLLGIISSLAILADRPAFTASLTVFLLLTLKREKLKNILAFLIPSVLLLVPYAVLMLKIGGLKINVIVFKEAGIFHNLVLEKFILLLPIMITLAVSFIFYFKEKKKYYREFLLWFIVSFVLLFFMSFKSRFFQFFLLPFYLVSGYWLKNRKKILVLLLIYSLIISIYIVRKYHFPIYPVQEVVNYVHANRPKDTNIAMISEIGDPLFSSSFMFPLSILDENKTIVFLRPCYFFDANSEEEISKILKDSGVYFVIAVKNNPEYEKLEMIAPRIEKVYERDIIEVYKFKDYTPNEKICNYICTTEEVLCTNYYSPYDVYKS